MDRNTDVHHSVHSRVRLEENTAKICHVKERVIEIDELFINDRLTLRRDSVGWDGFEREDGTYYRVNKRHGSDEYVTRREVETLDVIEAVDRQIKDPDIGGRGRLARGHSPK